MRLLHASFLVSSGVLAMVLPAQTPLTIVNNSFPTGTVGQLYAQALSATGGTQPYAWSAFGQIPPGLIVNTSGILIGTPKTGGTFTFTLTVTDASQTAVSKSLSIIISGGGSTPLTVATTALPDGAVGQSYSQTLAANGGSPPYQWLAGTGFPAFLTLNAATGVVSGTLTTAGTFSLAVQVTDSVGTVATGTLSLNVNSAPLTITTVPPISSGTVGVAYLQTFQASGGTSPYTWAIASGEPG
jgi:large repetitive protein